MADAPLAPAAQSFSQIEHGREFDTEARLQRTAIVAQAHADFDDVRRFEDRLHRRAAQPF